MELRERAMSPELTEAIERARVHVNAMTPEEYRAMLDKQRESWVRAMAPCEHGNPDFEQCGQCWRDAAMIAAFRTEALGEG